MAGYINGDVAEGLCLKALPEIGLLIFFYFIKLFEIFLNKIFL